MCMIEGTKDGKDDLWLETWLRKGTLVNFFLKKILFIYF